jgi:hypothetical protein
MYERNLAPESRSFKQRVKTVLAIGALSVATVAPNIYTALQPSGEQRQEAAKEMLELYGEAALIGGSIVAGGRMIESARQANDRSRTRPPQ